MVGPPGSELKVVSGLGASGLAGVAGMLATGGETDGNTGLDPGRDLEVGPSTLNDADGLGFGAVGTTAMVGASVFLK